MSSDHGTKNDGEKLRVDLIPVEVIKSLATVLQYGAKKYGDRNFEKGMEYSRVFAASQRHLWAWWGKEDNDEESGYNHLWHALCSVAMLVTLNERKKYGDDRP